MKKITPLSELPLSDDFMFGEVMSRKDIAKLFLEDLLDTKIARLEYVNKQETIEDGTDSRGIRLDIYLKDDANTVYDVEIQTTNERNLERRSRYYQQKIDARTLRKGVDYSELPDSYVIFVCTFDYFQYGLAVYEKESGVKNCRNIKYDDGSHVIFLNSAFSINNTSLPIEEFLKFLQTNDSDAPYESELAKKVVSTVNEVRNDTSREGIYMTFAMKLQETQKIAHKQGLEEGLKQGKAEGRVEGRVEGRIEGQLLALKEIMKNLGLSAKKAMDALGIPEANQPEYLAELEKDNMIQRTAE